MLQNVVYQKQLPFRGVLMDSWYATKDLMLAIEALHKLYSCPLKDNRQVDDSGAAQPYQRVDGLTWNAADVAHGKTIKIKGFPKDQSQTVPGCSVPPAPRCNHRRLHRD